MCSGYSSQHLLSVLIFSPHLCHRSHFEKSLLQGLPKFVGTLGSRPLRLEACLLPRNTVLHHLFYRAKFAHSRSNHTRVITEIRQKIWPLASLYSRSLEVTGTDTDRSATYDFLLSIVTMGLSRAVSEKRWISIENREFFSPRVFNASIEGVPLTYCNGSVSQKKIEPYAFTRRWKN